MLFLLKSENLRENTRIPHEGRVLLPRWVKKQVFMPDLMGQFFVPVFLILIPFEAR
jgi:hypothetical protein